MKRVNRYSKWIICITIISICIAVVCNVKYVKADGLDNNIKNTDEVCDNDSVNQDSNNTSNNKDVDNSVANNNESTTSNIENPWENNVIEENAVYDQEYNAEYDTGFNETYETSEENIVKNPIVISEKNITLYVGETKTLLYSNVTYISSNKDIVQVDSNGCIKAIKEGIASVIVSNDTDTKYIKVYVCNNTNMTGQEAIINTMEEGSLTNGEIKTSGNDICESTDEFIKLIDDTSSNIVCVPFSKYNVIPAVVLEKIYNENKVLEIDYVDYKLIIEGKYLNDISKNMDLNIDVAHSNKYEDSYEIKVNQKLPGKVILKFTQNKYKKKYTYIYNNITKKYKVLSDSYKDTIDLKRGEQYLVTDTDLDKYVLDMRILIGIIIVFVVLIIIYIAIKKRYWFW